MTSRFTDLERRSVFRVAAACGTATPTLRNTSSVLFLLSYWLADVTKRDPWDPARFAHRQRRGVQQQGQ